MIIHENKNSPNFARFMTGALALSSGSTLTQARNLRETPSQIAFTALRYDNSSMVCAYTNEEGHLSNVQDLLDDSDCDLRFYPIAKAPEDTQFTETIQLDTGFAIFCNSFLNNQTESELQCIEAEQNKNFANTQEALKNEAAKNKKDIAIWVGVPMAITLCLWALYFYAQRQAS